MGDRARNFYLTKLGGAMRTIDAVSTFGVSNQRGRRNKNRWVRSIMCTSALAAALQYAGPLSAQEVAKRYDLNISAPTLADGLRTLQTSTGVSLSFSPDQVRGLSSPEVKGQLTVEEALTSLLVGTGLTVRSNGRGTYVILAQRANLAPTQNNVIPVAAQSEMVAQAAPSNSSEAPAVEVEEVVITGSRVVRDGYAAPTPLTVVGTAEIEAAARTNLADFVNTLPAVMGSGTPRTNAHNVSTGTGGLNTLSLRNLGANRTLVLLDGQRSPPSSLSGAGPDINTFPQGLVSRVDVVTGGASAAYGSDALSGVVNFILDKEFTGVKGEVSGGLTTYGDGGNFKTELTGGFGFNGGRGHVLLNGEINNNHGIHRSERPWVKQGQAIVPNTSYTATNGQPASFLIKRGAGLSISVPGGLITSGPLKGIAFGQGGVPRQFTYGTNVGATTMVGGDWESTLVTDNQDLDTKLVRQSAFLRVSYDVTDNIEVFAQAQWAGSHNSGGAGTVFNLGNVTIRSDNPFIPSTVATRIATLGITSFTLGTTNPDLPVVGSDNRRNVNREVIGANGDFEALGTDWQWDAYAQFSYVRASERSTDSPSTSRYVLANDAVVNPATGMIVCRSTLTNPANGCVPYNAMGVNVNSDAAIAYLMGSQAHRNQGFNQNVLAAAINGEPFSIWAGPVSLAFGAEHRYEKVKGSVDAGSLANDWFVGNFLATFGSYKVTEGFVETVVPLAKDAAFAESLDLNAAVRFTSYSTSGFVTTWKVGATWDIIPDIRVRATRSRDIRAPNLGDLYNAGRLSAFPLINPFTNQQMASQTGVRGNPALEPEKADTTGVGVVLQPQFLPGVSLSADYWNIDITEGISSLPPQVVLDRCGAGQQQYCEGITFSNDPAVRTIVLTPPFNIARQVARGLDFEASYRTDLSDIVSAWTGSLTIRALGTYYLEFSTDDSLNPPYDLVGVNNDGGQPRWTSLLNISYSNDPITVNLTGRGISSGVYASPTNRTYIACASGCPASTATAPTIDDNRIDGRFYLDANIKYRLMHVEDDGVDLDAFLSVDNVLNKEPPVVAIVGGMFFGFSPTNRGLYDTLGRNFHAGIRFRM